MKKKVLLVFLALTLLGLDAVGQCLAPIINANKIFVCGTEQATLTVSGCSGTVWWENNTTTTAITRTVGIGTYYAQCRGGSCGSGSGSSNTIQVAYTPTLAPEINTDKSILCNGEQATLTVSGCTGNVQWSDGVTSTAMTRVITMSNATAGTPLNYTAICVGTCSSSAYSNSIILNPKTVLVPSVTTNKSTICTNETATLTATGCSGNIKWSTGVTTTVNTLTVSTITTYSARCIETCAIGEASNSITISATSIQTPSLNSDKNLLASGQQATLTVSGCNGVVKWYDNSTSTAMTRIVNTTGSFYVSCISSCGPSSYSNSMNIASPPTGTTPGVSANKYVFCGTTEQVILTVSNCSGVVKWFDGVTSTAMTRSVPNSSYCYAYCINSGVTSSNSTPFSLSQTPTTPPTISIDKYTVCGTEQATLTVTGCTGIIRWEDYSTTTAMTRVVSLASTVNNATYYAYCIDACGTSSNSNYIYINKTPIPAPQISADKYIVCGTEQATLTVTGCNGTVKWPDNSTAGTVRTVSVTGYNGTSQSDYSSYYCYCVGTCGQSAQSNSVHIYQKKTDIPTLSADKYLFCGNQPTVLTVSGCTGLIKWQDVTTTTATTRSVVATPSSSYSQYYVYCTGSCGTITTNSNILTIYQNTISPSISSTASSNINPTANFTLTASACTAPSTLLWEDGSTASVRSVTKPTITTNYSVTCTNSSCVSLPQVYTIYMLPIPTITASATTICAGTTITLTATGCDSPNYVIWSTGATGTSLTASPSSSYYGSFYARCYASASFYSAQSPTTNITVNDAPYNTPSISKTPSTNIDPGTSVVLSVSSYYCASPSILTWNNSLGTGLSKTVTPSVTTTYTAICTNAAGCSSPTGTITVYVDRIKINTTTPAISCSGRTIPVNFASSGSFTDPNFTVKLKKIVDTYGGCSTGLTELVSQTTTSSPLSITLPENLTPSGINGYCYSQYSGSIPITVSYYIEISNGTEISAKYYVKIYNVCSPILNIAVTSTAALCLGTNNAATATFFPEGINAGNVYTVLLSDVGGTTFPSTPIVIGTLASNTATSIPLTIPAGTATGAYNIKVKSSDPVGENIMLSTGYGVPYLSVTAIAAPVLSKNPTTDVAAYTSVILTATGCVSPNIVTWDNASTGTTRTVYPAITTSYTATCSSGTCSSALATISVNVISPPVISPTTQAICSGGNTALYATGCSSPDVVTWYVTGSASPIGTGTTKLIYLTTTNTVDTYTYYANCTRGSATSVNSSLVTINVNKIPSSPASISKSITTPVNPNTLVILTATGCVSGNTIKWNDNNTTNPRTVSPAYTTTYTAKCINGACESVLPNAVTVDVIGSISVNALSQTSYCPSIGNTIPVTFTASGTSGVYTILLKQVRNGYCSGIPPQTVASVSTATTSGTITIAANLPETGSSANCLQDTYAYTISVTDGTITSATIPISLVSSQTITDLVATPAKITTVGGSSVLSATCAGGNIIWYDGTNQIGTGASITVTPTSTTGYATTSYNLRCTNITSGCSKSASIALPYVLTVAGTGVTNLTGDFEEISCSYCYDENTYYYTKNLVSTACGQYGVSTCTTSNRIKRTNKIWEIIAYATDQYNSPSLTRLYHTKFVHDTKRPPCSAIWIKDADGTEVTLNNSGVCENVDNTIASITTPASVCAGQTVPITFTTTASAVSYTIELVRDLAYYIQEMNFHRTEVVSTITTSTTTTQFSIPVSYTISGTTIVVSNSYYSNERDFNTYRIRITPVGATQGVSQSITQVYSQASCPPPPCATITIVATPALVLGTTSTLTVSGCNSPNTITWSGGVTGTMTSVTVTPTGIATYTATCSGAGCTASVATNNSMALVSAITVSGSTSSNGSYDLGCYRFTAYFPDPPYSTQVSICPTSPDAGTNYYSNGSVQSGQYTGPYTTNTVVRKNNVWEIQKLQPNLTQRLYHTKFQYNGSQPPCTAVWINDADGSEVTLTIGGACQNETACPTMTVSSSVATPLPANTVITLTATGCSSPSVVTWNTGATGSTLSLTPTAATTYIATCFGATCSSSIASIAITMQCATVLTLASVNASAPSDDISSGTVIKQASSGVGGTIAATNKITGSSTKVTYQAKNIQLNAGFKADNGTVFKAEVGGCM